jgi:hypothetical protein
LADALTCQPRNNVPIAVALVASERIKANLSRDGGAKVTDLTVGEVAGLPNSGGVKGRSAPGDEREGTHETLHHYY